MSQTSQEATGRLGSSVGRLRNSTARPTVNHQGHLIGDAILAHLDADSYNLVGHPMVESHRAA